MQYIILLIFYTIGINLQPSKAEALLSEDIVGGYEIYADAITYSVSVQANGEHVCVGGILSDWLVSSAAHCLVNKTLGQFHTKKFKVVVTSNFLLPHRTLVSVSIKKLYLPPTFNVTTMVTVSIYEAEFDFVIFKLKRELGLGVVPRLRALQLYRTMDSPEDNYIISGHGVHALSQDGSYLPMDGKLRFAEVQIISNQVCGDLHEHVIPNYLLCARVRQVPITIRGTCTGDSGAPLVLNHQVIVAVLIKSDDTCSEDKLPSIYMKISHYMEFIESAKKNDTSNMLVYKMIKSIRSTATAAS